MKQEGFTLIELVVVIVILGILAAVALPRFVDFKGDATQARLDGIAGALASASAMNYGKYQISSGAATSVSGSTTATACDPVTGLLTTPWPPAPSVSVVLASGTCSAGATVTCTLTDTSTTPNKTSNAVVTCTN